MLFEARRNPRGIEGISTCVKSQLAYRREVWLLLHNSESSTNETAAVRLYLDESGTDESSPQAVVGGLLINYSHYLNFEQTWDEILADHGITPPLHMKEFGKDRRLGAISRCCRKELFVRVVELIRSHRVGTLEATLSPREYVDNLPKPIRDHMSIYGMCFSVAAVQNHRLAETANYQGRIPFIMDAGNPYAEHVRIAHRNFLQLQREGGSLHAGGLYFDDDAEFGVLQAADVIAWGVRRIASGLAMPPGMEPIQDLFDSNHSRADFKAEWMKLLTETFIKSLKDDPL